MRQLLSNALAAAARWLASDTKAAASSPPPPHRAAPGWADHYRRLREPTARELLDEMKNVAFACASINAAVCAAHPPRLYVKTRPGQAKAKCLTKALTPGRQVLAAWHPVFKAHATGAALIEEVTEHPILDLFRQVNPTHNSHDLWELLTFSQECLGRAYWRIDLGPLGIPRFIWPLPAQAVKPVRHEESSSVVDWYEYAAARGPVRYRPEEIIAFRYPDLRDLYLGGLSPLRAAWEFVGLHSEYVAFKRARLDNHALPNAIVSPDEDGTLGQEEAERLEEDWNQKLRRGGNGRIFVADNKLKVSLLQQSLSDLAELAEQGATAQTIANAFGVPVAMLTSEVNMANMQASEQLHAITAIRPRLARRHQKLNEALIPFYDPSGRLFLASDDPSPEIQALAIRQQESDLKLAVRTINEVRAERGMEPVPWGDEPWTPIYRYDSDRDDEKPTPAPRPPT